MPSTSAKQHRFMQAVAHSPSFAKKAGVSQSVGKDFSAADKGKTFNKGGTMKKGKRFNGDDGESEVEYDSDKTYSGRFTDDETGGLAENTPTRPTAKAAPSRAPAVRARAVSAPAAAPAASKADPEADFSGVKSGSSTSRAASPARFPIYTEAEQARRDALEMEGIKWQAEQDAKKLSEAKKLEPLSNAEKLAIVGTSAVAAGLTAESVSRLAGKKAGTIRKIIEKFTSKGSKTPEPQVIRSNRPSANARPEITILNEEKKLAELASSAAREKAAGAATPRRFSYQTDKIQIPTKKLTDTIAERAAAAKARAPTGDRDRFSYQTDKIQTSKKTLPDTIAERAAAVAERSKARGGRIVRMASGGSVSAASSRADGIAQRGKTKFRIY